MAEPPKSGRIRQQDYEAENFLQHLDPVVDQLREDMPQANYDRRGLGQLIGQFMQFQEDALGINAIQGQHKKQPKIPAKLLHTFTPRGPVFVFAAICHQFRARNPSIKRIDFMSPAKRSENINIWSTIRAALQREGFLQPPRVHVHQTCGSQSDQLQRIVMDMGGEIAQSSDSAGVSQVVYPFGPKGDPDDGVQYMRVQERRESNARVHWWYWPDSYDSWIPADQAPETDEPDKPSRGPRKVYFRWLIDSKKFNEWMNPVDYETEEYQAEQDALEQASSRQHPDGISGKRKLSPGHEGQAKRARTGEPGKARDPGQGWHKAGPTQQLPPHVAWNDVTEAERRTLDGSASAENISRGQQSGSARPNSYKLPQAAGPDPVSGGVPTNEAQLNTVLYTVPSHSAWFRYTAIHEIERKSVPDFFDGRATSKTPKVYRDYRNFMVNKYREDAKRRLTFTECRKLLAGDAMGVFNVWQFLDSWGIINYQAPTPPSGTAEEGGLNVQSAGPPNLLKVLAAGPSSSNALFQFSLPKATDGVAAAGAGALDGLNLITRKDAFGRSASQATGNQVKYFCNVTNEECSARRYHCIRMPDVDLSPAAYAAGKFPPGCSSKDFVLIDQAEFQTQPQDWSDQETLLLLEGLELHKDKWGEIADHVGTKSQVQCIMQFLQLPIEDNYLDQLEDQVLQPAGTASADQDNGQAVEDQALIPFADTGNPILSQVAFLAAMVGPKVAAAAAQKALEVLSEEDPAIAAEAAALDANGQQQQNRQPDSNGAAPDAPVSSSRMRVAAATALGAAAVKAKLLADAEERELQKQVQIAVEAQMQKVQLKLNSMKQLDEALEKERSTMETQRQQLVQARVGLQEQQAVVQKQVQQLQMHQAAQQSAAAAAASQAQNAAAVAASPAATNMSQPAQSVSQAQQKPGTA